MIPTAAQTAPYPLNQFYAAISDAAWEVCKQTQAPPGLVGMEFLAVMAAAAQGLFDIRLPTGHVRPLSLAIAILAESGERMTGVHNLVARALDQFDVDQLEQYEIALSRYETELAAWEPESKGLKRKLMKAAQDGAPTEDHVAHIKAHMAMRPVKPRVRRLLRQNMSVRALYEALQGDGASIGFITDEVELIRQGGPFDMLGLANKLWDGAPVVTYDRAHARSIVARGARMTTSFKAQPEIFEAMLKQRGSAMRGSGYWARFLIGAPMSTQGTRFSADIEVVWEHLPKFQAHLAELLAEYGQRQAAAGPFSRGVLELSLDARRLWHVLSNQVESMLGPAGFLADIKDCASKSMEIVGRVAALQHIYGHQKGMISSESLSRAFNIVVWHVNEFKRIFSAGDGLSMELRNAQVLEDYLHRRYWSAGSYPIPKNEVLKSGPLRPRAKLDSALDYLQTIGKLWIGIGPDKRTRYINCGSSPWGYPSGSTFA